MSNEAKNFFAAKGNVPMRTMMASRTVEDECKFILPVLDRLSPDFTLCGAGCGPGGIAVSIAKRYPAATILGFDIDGPSIEEAQGMAKDAGVQNTRFAIGSALEFDEVAATPGFEALAGGCDVVLKHVTMMHLPKSLEMLKQMRKAAKPGGWIACRAQDAELNMFYPANKGLEYWNKVFVDMIRARGCDTQCGRKMLHYALQAGFVKEKIRVQSGDFTFNTTKKQLWVDSVTTAWTPQAQDMIEKSIGYRVDTKLLNDGWQAWHAQDDAWFSLFTIELVCQK